MRRGNSSTRSPGERKIKSAELERRTKGASSMETWILVLGWMGIYGPVALASVGSAVGCTRAGKAACGAILEVDGGYGRYIGLSVLPSSIVIYGIVIMFSLNRTVGPATSPGLLGVGLLVGIALLYIAILQGQCCAAAINASKGKPAIFGISVTPAAIVEGFAVFAFVFALIVSAAIPKG